MFFSARFEFAGQLLAFTDRSHRIEEAKQDWHARQIRPSESGRTEQAGAAESKGCVCTRGVWGLHPGLAELGVHKSGCPAPPLPPPLINASAVGSLWASIRSAL